jgi:hypothetical protein
MSFTPIRSIANDANSNGNYSEQNHYLVTQNERSIQVVKRLSQYSLIMGNSKSTQKPKSRQVTVYLPHDSDEWKQKLKEWQDQIQKDNPDFEFKFLTFILPSDDPYDDVRSLRYVITVHSRLIGDNGAYAINKYIIKNEYTKIITE